MGEFGPGHEDCTPGISGSALRAAAGIIPHAIDFSIMARMTATIVSRHAGSARLTDKLVAAPVPACVLDMLELAHPDNLCLRTRSVRADPM